MSCGTIYRDIRFYTFYWYYNYRHADKFNLISKCLNLQRHVDQGWISGWDALGRDPKSIKCSWTDDFGTGRQPGETLWDWDPESCLGRVPIHPCSRLIFVLCLASFRSAYYRSGFRKRTGRAFNLRGRAWKLIKGHFFVLGNGKRTLFKETNFLLRGNKHFL